MSIPTASDWRLGRLGRQALPWFALFALSLTFAQVLAVCASALPAAETAPVVVSTKSGLLADDMAISAASRVVLDLITIRGAANANEAEMLCRTTEYQTSSDALLMDIETARDVLPVLCESSWVPAPVL
jgi:hypothetical protein